MQHCDVGITPFLPTDEDGAKAIHPAMGAFHDPATSPEPGRPLDRSGLLAARTNVRGQAELDCESTNLVVVVTLVEAPPLRSALRWPRPIDENALDRVARHLEVVAVGPVHGDADRNAVRFGQHAALGTTLGSVGWIGAGFFPLREEPS
jgi:hypothetical protein